MVLVNDSNIQVHYNTLSGYNHTLRFPSKNFRCSIPHAPFSQSRTKRYFRTSLQLSTSHVLLFPALLSCTDWLSSLESRSVLEGVGMTLTGIENDNPVALEIHRYISGSFLLSSSSSASPSNSSPGSASEP